MKSNIGCFRNGTWVNELLTHVASLLRKSECQKKFAILILNIILEWKIVYAQFSIV